MLYWRVCYVMSVVSYVVSRVCYVVLRVCCIVLSVCYVVRRVYFFGCSIPSLRCSTSFWKRWRVTSLVQGTLRSGARWWMSPSAWSPAQRVGTALLLRKMPNRCSVMYSTLLVTIVSWVSAHWRLNISSDLSRRGAYLGYRRCYIVIRFLSMYGASTKSFINSTFNLVCILIESQFPSPLH